MKPRHPAPLNALRAFEAAARCLSFQDAAARLFVTPAAVSHQVKRLEAYLGVELFKRGHRTVALTAEGEALAATLGELFSKLDLALDRATAPTTADLRVSTMESFAAKWLAPRLHRFHRIRPDLRVRIETGDAHVDFVRDGIDVAIRYGPGGYGGVDAERLMEAAVFPVCAPALQRDTARPLVSANDLRHHTLLHDESAQGRTGVPGWPEWLDAAGAARVHAGGGPVFASIYLAQEAAIAGHGVALGVAPLVAEDLRSGRLARPFELALDNAYAFWIVRRRAAAANPAVDAFCEWLRGEAVGETQPSR
ncbi:transcriptional regulator GcvA [Luteimonas saliphila]|uniref:transcriptional regulator GcvA n=1 Tax=Luteimonas saliphila TaxID=2804919 RepID=UPI00192D2E5A